jgi:hypothetical protein
MKQLFRDQIPADKAKELEGVRFVKMKREGPFGGKVLAKGDDPNEVNDSVADGVLYRIDEHQS